MDNHHILIKGNQRIVFGVADGLAVKIQHFVDDKEVKVELRYVEDAREMWAEEIEKGFEPISPEEWIGQTFSKILQEEYNNEIISQLKKVEDTDE